MRTFTVSILVLMWAAWPSSPAAADPAAGGAPSLASFDRAVCVACAPSAGACRSWRMQRPRRGDRWRFGISLYGWLAGTDGTIWADGESRDFELDFEQALEKTNGGLQVYAEARKGPWFLALDVTYADMGDEGEGALGILKLEAEVVQWIVDARVGYRVWRHVLSRRPGLAGSKPCRTLDAYVFTGARYYRTDLTFDVATAGGLLSRQLRDTDETLDPLLGLRVRADLACRWTLDLRGDAGAFGDGFDDSDYSWETAAYVGYALTRRWFLYAGYRVQGQRRLTGEGAEKSGQDLVSHGPLVGFGFAL